MTRDLILKSPCPPKETGDLAYRATVSASQIRSLKDAAIDELCSRNQSTMWLGPGGHTVLYPIKDKTEFNMVLVTPDNLDPGTRTSYANVDEMMSCYDGWDDR